MKLIIVVSSIIFSLLISSCNGQDIEKIISKIDREDLSFMKGLSVYYRSHGTHLFSSTYFINKYEGNCSPYAVEVDNHDWKIIEINNDLVLKSCEKDFLDTSNFQNIISKFLSLQMSFIKVDHKGNIYINPNEQAQPILLKRLSASSPEEIMYFKHYRDNWYIRE